MKTTEYIEAFVFASFVTGVVIILIVFTNHIYAGASCKAKAELLNKDYHYTFLTKCHIYSDTGELVEVNE